MGGPLIFHQPARQSPDHVKDSQSPLALALLMFATLAWGGNIVIGRAVRNELPPLGLSFWRWAVAFLVILVFTFPLFVRSLPVIRREWKLLSFIALLGMASFHPLQYFAVQTTTVLNSTLILSTSPAMVVILSMVLHGERLKPVQIIGALISFVGVGVVMSRGDWSTLANMTFTQGDIWMLAASIVWSLYSTAIKFRPPDLHPHVMLATTALLGAIFLFPFYLWESQTIMAMPVTSQSLMVIAYISLVASILAYLSFNQGVNLIGPARAGVVLHMVPVWASLLAILFLGERFYSYHLIGLVFIVTGILLNTQPFGRKQAT